MVEMIDVKECIANVLAIKDLTTIVDDDNITEKLNADSLDSAEIIMNIESKYNINISDDIADTLLTPNDIFKYLISLGL